MMQEADTVKAIRSYRRQGVNAIPLCPPRPQDHARMWASHAERCGSHGKAPVGRWKATQIAIPDEAESEALLRAMRERGLVPNVGVVMGPTSRLIAIDADGPEAVEWCESRWDRLLDTARFTTGRGMRWVWSSHPGEGDPWPASQVLHPGIELLSIGRQSVFPPSLHANGKRYAWVECDRRTWMSRLVPWPSLPDVDPCSGKRIGTRGGDPGQAVLKQGERNDSLFRMACSLRRHGVGIGILRDCLHHLNGMCDPPLPDDEIDRVAASAARYAHRIPTAEERKAA